jgi:hypothetical protein
LSPFRLSGGDLDDRDRIGLQIDGQVWTELDRPFDGRDPVALL